MILFYYKCALHICKSVFLFVLTVSVSKSDGIIFHAIQNIQFILFVILKSCFLNVYSAHWNRSPKMSPRIAKYNRKISEILII